MFKIYLSLFLLFLSFNLTAQVKRNISFRIIGKDSVNLHLDPNYDLIEDSCSSIIRYSRFDPRAQKFKGTFKDVLKKDSSVIVSSGTFSEEGKLNGPLVINYLDGTKKTSGNVINGVLQGKWEFFFANGKKELEYEYVEGVGKILNAWDITGKQIITNGKGAYRVDIDKIYWEGKLEGGLPDGTWRSKLKQDNSGTILSTETFKNGVLIKGTSNLGNYSDVSKIILQPNHLLTVLRANEYRISMAACDGSLSYSSFTSATYKYGNQEFTNFIFRLVRPVFAKVNLTLFNNREFNIIGTINEKGVISALKFVDYFDDRQAGSLLSALIGLPVLNPALENGKPIKSSIIIYFRIERGTYWTRWSTTRFTDAKTLKKQ